MNKLCKLSDEYSFENFQKSLNAEEKIIIQALTEILIQSTSSRSKGFKAGCSLMIGLLVEFFEDLKKLILHSEKSRDEILQIILICQAALSKSNEKLMEGAKVGNH